MKNFYKARERLEEEAIGFLKSGLYSEHPENCPQYVHFGISAVEKAKNSEHYQRDILHFKTLFNADEGRYRLTLWNMIVNYYSENLKVCKKDFSEEEYAFISAASEAVWMSYEANINKPINTERLILRAIEKRDRRILAEHFKNDGDFTFFTGSKPTNKNIREFTLHLRRNTYFAIERKSDGKLLGYIGLSVKKETSTGLLEYYLFKEDRKKGYCKEAVEVLTKITLRGKLYEPVETIQLGVFRKKAIHLNAIRARISSFNIASRKTVESCNFAHEATFHQTMNRGTAAWTDEEIYYLTSAMIK